MSSKNDISQDFFWNFTIPENQSMDSKKLIEMKNYLKTNFPEYYSILIIRNGHIIFNDVNKNPKENIISKIMKTSLHTATRIANKPSETFIDKIEDTYNLRSATKSIVSLLIGIAIDHGMIESIDVPVYKYFPDIIINDDSLKKEITIRHLLDMTAGFPSIEGSRQSLKFTFNNGDWINYIWNMELENTPGIKFEYNSANTHLLSGIITNVSGMNTFEFAQKYLFNPLGISNFSWGTDKKGICFGGGNLFLNIYDFAKIGYLCLNKSKWNNEIIVSEEWLQQSITSYHEWLYGFNYGFLWYIKEEECIKTNNKYLTYSASGAGGQKLIIIPEANIIIAAVSRTDLTRDNSYHINNVVGKFVLPAIM